jgi:hypothetical protein
MVGDEVDDFLAFVAGIRSVSLSDADKVHISDDALKQLVLNKTQAERLFTDYQDLFLEIAQREDLQKDLIAIGYRRKQLERFEQFLRNEEAFACEQARLATTPEGVWQAFFEANSWIFGYGLSYQFLSRLDGRKLEQIVRGFDLTGTGKRADALLKTQGAINSLCFVEIKRHDTPLLAGQSYRPGAWPPSGDLAAAVSQVQATVQDAIEKIGRTLSPTKRDGDPTAELLFNVVPRSFLIIGNMDQFDTPNGVNEMKVRAFELYRRGTRWPEILTFDELLHRARFIVEQVPD